MKLGGKNLEERKTSELFPRPAHKAAKAQLWARGPCPAWIPIVNEQLACQQTAFIFRALVNGVQMNGARNIVFKKQ